MNKSAGHFKGRGFTMVELMVAAGILGLMVAFASVIFRFSIDAYSVASANAEIMQKLRCITEQLNDDFRGLRKDAPMFVWFEQDTVDDDPNRYDQIMFFADGDFTSVQLYSASPSNKDPISIVDINNLNNTMVVRGNVARIQYALARNKDNDKAPELDDQERILARRAHILTADEDLIQWPDPNQNFNDFKSKENDDYEHDSVSLAQWKVVERSYYENDIIRETFDEPPKVDKERPRTFHLLMSEAVGSFSIQWAYWEEISLNDWELRWFPSDDPDDNGNDSDSQLDLMGTKYPEINGPKFGCVFNIPDNQQMDDWLPPDDLYYDSSDQFDAEFFPVALKFTFRLYDSKGIIKGGRTFTHIIYLED